MSENKEEQFPFMIFMTVRALIKKLNRVFNEHQIPISIEQFGLLVLLNEMPDELSQQEIANFLEKDKSAVLRSIDLLENKGYLQRVSNSEDRRVNRIQLTAEGKKMFEQAQQIERQVIEQIEEGISVEERQIFKKTLLHIREAALH